MLPSGADGVVAEVDSEVVEEGDSVEVEEEDIVEEVGATEEAVEASVEGGEEDMLLLTTENMMKTGVTKVCKLLKVTILFFIHLDLNPMPSITINSPEIPNACNSIRLNIVASICRFADDLHTFSG